MIIRKNDEETEENVQPLQLQRKMLILLLILCILQMVALFVLAGHWRRQREESLAPRQQKMCYPRYKLVTGYDGNVTCPITFTNDKTKNVSYCCGDLSDVLNSVVKKISQKRYDSEINPEMVYLNLTYFLCFSTKEQQEQPMQKLTHEHTSNPLRIRNKIFWKRSFSSSANSKLKYLEDDGTVLIEESGFFFIFSQLKIKVDNMAGDIDNNVRHSINLIPDINTAVVLLEDAMSPCEVSSNGPPGKTSTIGAAFRLRQGDRLFVAISQPNSIVPDHLNSHFSVYKL